MIKTGWLLFIKHLKIIHHKGREVNETTLNVLSEMTQTTLTLNKGKTLCKTDLKPLDMTRNCHSTLLSHNKGKAVQNH